MAIFHCLGDSRLPADSAACRIEGPAQTGSAALLPGARGRAGATALPCPAPQPCPAPAPGRGQIRARGALKGPGTRSVSCPAPAPIATCPCSSWSWGAAQGATGTPQSKGKARSWLPLSCTPSSCPQTPSPPSLTAASPGAGSQRDITAEELRRRPRHPKRRHGPLAAGALSSS